VPLVLSDGELMENLKLKSIHDVLMVGGVYLLFLM